jgi:hypothetical protein
MFTLWKQDFVDLIMGRTWRWGIRRLAWEQDRLARFKGYYSDENFYREVDLHRPLGSYSLHAKKYTQTEY